MEYQRLALPDKFFRSPRRVSFSIVVTLFELGNILKGAASKLAF